MLDGSLRFVDGWTLEEGAGAPATSGTLFTTSNGYLGLRPGPFEPFASPESAAFVNGCYETRPYAHPERAFGFPDRYQTILPVTQPCITLEVDGTSIGGDHGRWQDRSRRLDLRTGCVSTSATLLLPSGQEIRLRTRRITSLAQPGLAHLEAVVEPQHGETTVELDVALQANTSIRTFPDEPEALGQAWGRVLRPGDPAVRGDIVALVHTTPHSRVAIAAALRTDAPGDVATAVGPDRSSRRHRTVVTTGAPLVVRADVAYAHGAADEAPSVLDRAAALAAAGPEPFDELVERQREVLERFWSTAAVDIDGAPDVEGAARFSMFHLLQSSILNGERASPAKGLTGQGYQGHHLWDQEIYVDHALSWVAPELVREMIGFRCRTLPEARERARAMSHDGAQFPWRTIDGREASAFFPAGAAQHHVNADIAWVVELYFGCTGDHRFLVEHGIPVLVETARLWASIGHVGRDGTFRIGSITGPDEYTALVDNNLFTNLMAAANLRSAADRLEWLGERDPAAHARLVDDLRLGPEEIERWRAAAASVHLPFDDALGVHGQDDTFLDKPRWDLAATPADRFPLQDHHHLLTLYRHQVLKQADVVLALFLHRERFDLEQRRRDFDYYEPLTTHDSSLSRAIHAVVAADVGHLDTAWRYTSDAALTDLDDRYGTLGDGIHMASAAGSWLAVACGFGGLRLEGGQPSLRPRPMPGIDRYAFRLRHRSSTLAVEVRAHEVCYRLLAGSSLELDHDGQRLTLTEEAVTLPLGSREPRPG